MQDQDIKRRTFLRGAAALGGALLLGQTAAMGQAVPKDKPIKTVYVVFKCHLDLGFTGTQAEVLRTSFDHHFPEAMQRAADLRAAGGTERYVWTVGAWLMAQYLAQATPAQAARAAHAIVDGDLAWHALPFNWQTEMLDPSLLDAGLDIFRKLDARFGTKTTGAKLTDVPGHTRGLVGPLARSGVTLLDIGVNPASMPPDVPTLFRWRDPEGAEVITLYHGADYGGTVTVPGGEIAVSVHVRGDNTGVHTIEEIKTIYADLARQFPGAKMIAATLSEVAAALEPFRDSLPVVTEEIGDSWVYGCASDPVKMGRYRELSRLRQEWLTAGRLKEGGMEDAAFVSWLLLAPEHTWGCDIKTELGDWSIYTPAELKTARGTPNFQKVQSTWAEKRANNDRAVAALPLALAAEARTRLAELAPNTPGTTGLTPLHPGEIVTTPNFLLSLDPATGALCRLQNRKTGREWASPTHPLGQFAYRTFSAADYTRFLGQYLKIKDWWPPQDFGKPGLDKYPVESRTWLPVRHESWTGREAHGTRIVTALHLPDAGAAAPYVAWPEHLWLTLTLPDDTPEVQMDFQWFGKAANRLPESLWLSFSPVAPDPEGWRLDKAGRAINPREVVRNGGRGQHGVARGASYHDTGGHLMLDTLDAPLLVPGRRTLLDFDNRQPDMTGQTDEGGVHVNLFNNVWGTNYVMWLDDDLRFRFVLRV